MAAHSVRKIRTGDLASVYSLGKGMLFSSEEGVPWSPESIADILCSDPGLSFVCLDRKRITGFLIACDCRDREQGARIQWLWAERDSWEIKDNLLLAFYDEAVLRDISPITASVWSDEPRFAEYLKGRGFREGCSRTVTRLVLTDIPRGPGTGEKP